MEDLSVKIMLRMLNGIFKKKETPLPPLPPPLLLLGSNNRGGLSARRLASNIISRQNEAGIASGKIFNKNENKSELLEIIRSEEIINELMLNGKVEIVIPPGVQINGTITATPPLPFVGITTSIAKGTGIIR